MSVRRRMKKMAWMMALYSRRETMNTKYAPPGTSSVQCSVDRENVEMWRAVGVMDEGTKQDRNALIIAGNPVE